MVVKNHIHVENLIDLFEHLLMDFVSFMQEDEYLFRFRQNHVEVEDISLIVIFRYSNFAFVLQNAFLNIQMLWTL